MTCRCCDQELVFGARYCHRCGLEVAATSARPFPSEYGDPVLPEWAELIEDDPLSFEAGDRSLVRALRDRRSGIEMLLVPAGTFRRGAPADQARENDDALPMHVVTISRPYYLGRHPVTRAEWRRLVTGTIAARDDDRRPVAGLSWNEVVLQLASGSGFRLPTEAEWEHACRAGEAWPAERRADELAWFGENSGFRPRPVGEKKANAWGFHDLLGNVEEHCVDGYHPLAYARWAEGIADPIGPFGSAHRVRRGGSHQHQEWQCRPWTRSFDTVDSRCATVGFRVARFP